MNNTLTEAILSMSPPVIEKIEYRIYYDEQGVIVSCSMQQHPLTGKYIVVTKQQHSEYYKYTVQNGKLVEIIVNKGMRFRLKKSTSGYKTVNNHAGLLIEDGDTYNGDTEYYN